LTLPKSGQSRNFNLNETLYFFLFYNQMVSF